MKKWAIFVLFVGLFAPVCAAVTINWVPVGDAGNSDDTTNYGGVPYEYRISSKEITNTQYRDFLNAVGRADASPYFLWNSNMEITRSGSSPNYSYEVQSGRGNYPIRYITWLNALRFVNWLHNGQPTTGAPGPSTTEDGAYTIDNNYDYGASRNPGAEYWLPTEDEWYKAAFYKGGGTSAGYWPYATSNTEAPTREIPAGGPNSANFYQVMGDPYTSVVGAYWQSVSPYGTYDQCGNVAEWTEESAGSNYKPTWGGSFYSNPAPDSSARSTVSYDGTYNSIGFRVAAHRDTIEPEPYCTEFPKADLDRDCKVNLADLAEMAEEWTVCNLVPPEACNP
jgi:sulfatase modifying factor 1